MQLEDWLDDLCVRFIINLPPEELESVERICFQVEEAQWFYEDFIRPLDPNLPSLNLRAFSLRIFQHCPLFSQWSAQHHTTAFAEFLAYKSRVPVRGAIMLNEAMDEVVLVKGWKKGANWSFPRGKINKDEDDLDCAVREVYEETGYDIQAAGLVQDPKKMKYIEVTMREQHMRLYVFRGVPKDTYFAPRTRKEISKIDWYKLTDLPTLKKHKHQDSNGDALAINANKFYMVAPFLTPLKKWIAQQKKQGNRRSLQPAYLAPPPFAEETVTEDDDFQKEPHQPGLSKELSRGPSDLPEVSLAQPQANSTDASSHLKRLLNIDFGQQQQEPVSPLRKAPPNVDTAKSGALLALLRGNSTAELRAGPSTPFEQISFPPNVPRSAYRSHPRPPTLSSMPSPPPFPVSPDGNESWQRMPSGQTQRIAVQQQTQFDAFRPTATFAHQHVTPTVARNTEQSLRPSPPVAPYQRTGDPEFSFQLPGESRQSFAPPASALPKLTNHTRALLDVFKTGPLSVPKDPGTVAASIVHPPRAHGTAHAPSLSQTQSAVSAQPEWQASTITPSGRGPHHESPGKGLSSKAVQRPKSIQQASLLDLFKEPSVQGVPASIALRNTSQRPLVELAANSTHDQVVPPSKVLLRVLKRESEAGKVQVKKRTDNRIAGEGETSATISGPLNQPHFDGIAKTTRHANNGLGRSPVAANRTLYDPKQPTPVKILARPDESKRSPARSPRAPKAAVSVASPRRTSTPKEQPKPFQPQILRRPQTAESQTAAASAHLTTEPKSQITSGNRESQKSSIGTETLPAAKPKIDRQPSDVNTHRQTLLSLFSKPATTMSSPTTPRDLETLQGVVSPLLTNQMVSPPEDRSVQGMEPISTRSRVGSLASIASSSVRPTIERRQTAAGNKAFLLGYLGRIASRDA